MTDLPLLRLLFVAAVSTPFLQAQINAAPTPQPSPATPRTSRYLTVLPLNLPALLLMPPAPGSPSAKADLLAVHEAETTRTPQQIAQAKLDDRTESIFIYTDVVGPHFQSSELPRTTALSEHLRAESGVVNPSMKLAFHRPRPAIADPTLHPVCEASKSDSYPSGHAMVGYLEAFALAQMLPEQSDAILKRADRYARNRIVCGVHYPTDVAASRTIALALYGALSTSARFREELASAQTEIRSKLVPASQP